MTKARTTDEKFIVCLYNASKAFHDMETPFNRYDVGKKVGIQDRGVNAICKLLLQANFIKNGEGGDVILTKNGEQLALRILDDEI
jgi:predicted transcriptional regulator